MNNIEAVKAQAVIFIRFSAFHFKENMIHLLVVNEKWEAENVTNSEWLCNGS